MKIKNFFYKYSIVLFIAAVSFLVVSFPFQYAQERMSGISQSVRWVGAIVFFLIFMFLLKCKDEIKKVLEKPQIFIIVLLLIIMLQLLTIFTFKVQPINDLVYLHDEAIRMLKNPQLSLERFHNYFGHYPNNYGYLIILYIYYKILTWIGISTTYLVFAGNILNMLFIDGGIVCGYVILRKIKNIRMSNLWMFLFLISPWTYCWIFYYYTHTVSFGVMMALFLLFVLLWKDRNVKRGMVWAVFLGFLIYLGMKIRITNLIICVAVVMAVCFFWKKERIQLKLIILLIAMFCGVFISVIGYQQKTGNMFPRENPQEFPATHWLMMASHGVGRYDSKDVAYTSSFSSKEERKKMTTENTVKNYKKLGVKKTLQLFGVKLRAVWLVGDDDFTKMTYASSDYHYINEYLSGKHDGGILMYSYLLRAVLWITSLISAIHLMKKRNQWEYIAMLCILGGMVFHMFWEANPKYSICFMGMMNYLMISGIEILSEKKLQKISVFQRSNIIPCAIIVIMILVLQPSYDYSHNKDVAACDKSYAAAQFTGSQTMKLYMKKNSTIKQSFKSNIEFKQITVKINNANNLKLCLTDQTGSVIEISDLKNIEYDGNKITWRLNKAREPGKYNIELVWYNTDKKVNLPIYSTANYDAYKAGYATIQGIKDKNTDLLFSVSD